MIELTESQREALQPAKGSAVRLIDPTTRQEYVLMNSKVFDRLTAAITEDSVVEDAYPLLGEQGRQAGWDDPEWDSDDVYARKSRNNGETRRGRRE